MDKFSILIVDDSNDDRYLLKRRLKDAEIQCRVFEESNGEHALSFLTDYDSNVAAYPDGFPPVLIFLDINMPLMNGFEFLENFDGLRNQFDLSSVVVVMFTSSGRPEDIEAANQFDFVKDHLVKGEFTADKLRSKIVELLPQHLALSA